MLPVFARRVQPSRRRARFPAGPLAASGSGPKTIDESRPTRSISDTKLNSRLSVPGPRATAHVGRDCLHLFPGDTVM